MAIATPKCLYCGAALPPDVVTLVEAREGRPEETPGPSPGDRILLTLDLGDADPGAVAGALGLSPYEAAQRIRRRGPQLYRVVPRPEAEEEAARLERLGLRVLAVPEADTRAAERPRLVRGGRFGPDALELRGEEGPFRVARADLLIVVRGPITREFQAWGEDPLPESLRGWAGFRVSSSHWRRGSARTLERALKVHLHEAADLRPVEIDPDSFAFGGTSVVESSVLLLQEWMDELARGVPLDDGFRHVPPALGPATSDASDPALLALSGGRRPGRGRGPKILDNLAQFRSYSAWRGALERLTRAGAR